MSSVLQAIFTCQCFNDIVQCLLTIYNTNITRLQMYFKTQKPCVMCKITTEPVTQTEAG